eukprot:TRINITY_DN2803_c0_g2_i1.p1 TRINITY_DN2803_c0_g2~~TRINITY_DN2803_c0_g2_i1.p1  ORF type:complete len:1072 (+),score=173.51 TRINITY_DN2803_c0_g2_i1:159-3374(+)
MDANAQEKTSRIAISRRNYSEARKKLAKRATCISLAKGHFAAAGDGFRPSTPGQQAALGRKSLAPVQKLKRAMKAFHSSIHDTNLLSSTLAHVKSHGKGLMKAEDQWELLLKAEAFTISEDVREIYKEMHEDWHETYEKLLAKVDVSKTQKKEFVPTVLAQTKELLNGIQQLKQALDPETLARNYKEVFDIAQEVHSLHADLQTEGLTEAIIQSKAEVLQQAGDRFKCVFSRLAGVALTKVSPQKTEPDYNYNILKSDRGPRFSFAHPSHKALVQQDAVSHRSSIRGARRSTFQLPQKVRPTRFQIAQAAAIEEQEEDDDEEEEKAESQDEAETRDSVAHLQYEHREHNRNSGLGQDHRVSMRRTSRKPVQQGVGESKPEKMFTPRLTIKSLSSPKFEINAQDQTGSDAHEKARPSVRQSIHQAPDSPRVNSRGSCQQNLRSSLPPQKQRDGATARNVSLAEPAALQEVTVQTFNLGMLPMQKPSGPKTPNKLRRSPKTNSELSAESTAQHKTKRGYARGRTTPSISRSQAADNVASNRNYTDSPQEQAAALENLQASAAPEAAQEDGAGTSPSITRHDESAQEGVDSTRVPQRYMDGHEAEVENKIAVREDDKPPLKGQDNFTAHARLGEAGRSKESGPEHACLTGFQVEVQEGGLPCRSPRQALHWQAWSSPPVHYASDYTDAIQGHLGRSPALNLDADQVLVRVDGGQAVDKISSAAVSARRRSAPLASDDDDDDGDDDLVIDIRSKDFQMSPAPGRLAGGHQESTHESWSSSMKSDKHVSDVLRRETTNRALSSQSSYYIAEDPDLDPALQEAAWSEPVRYVPNFAHSVSFHLGRPVLPGDKLRTKDGKEITYDDMKQLTWKDLQAVFPLQVQITEKHCMRIREFPWQSEARYIHNLRREQSTRTTIEQILSQRARTGIREHCVSQDMATEWKKYSDLIGPLKCTCCLCAECLNLEEARPPFPLAAVVRRAACLPITPDLLDFDHSETRAVRACSPGSYLAGPTQKATAGVVRRAAGSPASYSRSAGLRSKCDFFCARLLSSELPRRPQTEGNSWCGSPSGWLARHS